MDTENGEPPGSDAENGEPPGELADADEGGATSGTVARLLRSLADQVEQGNLFIPDKDPSLIDVLENEFRLCLGMPGKVSGALFASRTFVPSLFGRAPCVT